VPCLACSDKGEGKEFVYSLPSSALPMPGKRLELLQGCPHNDLNVTRIPFRHPGMYGGYYTAWFGELSRAQ